MKKLIYLFVAAALAVSASACSSGSQEKASDSAQTDAQFASEQPIPSGEYRANAFQYVEKDSKRMPFDGRMIVALKPGNSGILIYENGNRTNFRQSISISKEFEKNDSVQYVAVDNKNNPVTFIYGAEVDTLIFTKNGKLVKLAVEKKPISTLTPQEAWTRITSQLGK